MAFLKTLEDKKLIIHCDCCFKEITLDTFIRCGECTWDQCLNCFFAEIETRVHKRTHSYRVIENLSTPIFKKEDDEVEWRAIDDLLMLNAIITYGMGNYADISSILSPISEKEVKKHFFKVFGIIDDDFDEKCHTGVLKSDPNDTQVLSYMPKRGDFESELNHDYEALISNIQLDGIDDINSIDDGEDKLKVYMLEHYRTVLLQRSMWRNLIIDRNLVEVRKIRENESTKIQTLLNKYKWLLSYLSKNDFNKFISGLVREQHLTSIVKSKKENGSCIDEDKLMDISGMLGHREKELCRKVKISYILYARLKRFAIECYISKTPLKDLLLGFFDESCRKQVIIIYEWFKAQRIVHNDP